MSSRRPFKRSLDGSESPRPAKRHQHLLAQPLTPDESADEASRPNILSIAPSISLDRPKPTDAHIKPRCDRIPIPPERRVEDWLDKVVACRPKSCPPQLESCLRPGVFDLREEAQVEKSWQEPRSFRFLRQMSQDPRPTGWETSVASGRTSRPGTSNADYRTTLRNNGVHFNHTGKRIPSDLRQFLDTKILQERTTWLSAAEIADAVQTGVDIADSPEANVYDLINTALLPIKLSDVGRGGNTLWVSETLPRNQDYVFSLAAAKADVHCGYLVGQRSTWNVKENSVIDHPAARRFIQPAKGTACLTWYLSSSRRLWVEPSGMPKIKRQGVGHLVSMRLAGSIGRQTHLKSHRWWTRVPFQPV